MDVQYEDQLPPNMTDEEYDEWFKKSCVDFVRVGPKFEKNDYPESGMLPKPLYT